MALSIKNEEADRLARQVARLAGEGLTEAVVTALRERLERLKAVRRGTLLRDEIMAIGRRCAARAVLDERTPEQIVGYGPHGEPT